jgi:E3 ubiquitin-protein ligase MARCH6
VYRCVAGLLGLLIDLVMVVPLRVSFHQSPELFGVAPWMGGVLFLKLGCRVLVDTPSLAPLAPRFRLGVVEMSQRGWQNLHLLELLDKVGLPMITHLVLLLAIPYLFAWGVMPHFGASEKECVVFWRWSYPVVFSVVLSFWLIQRTGQAMSQVHNALRDSLYLVGRRLHNLPCSS